MSGVPYIRFVPDDWISRTLAMTPEERGLVISILALTVSDGAPPAADYQKLGRLIGCTRTKTKKLVLSLAEHGAFAIVDDCAVSTLYREWEGNKRRPSLPTHVRKEVFARDGKVCRYCGDERGPFALDHVRPWSRGGEDTPDNLVVACRVCNSSKKDKTPTEWLQ